MAVVFTAAEIQLKPKFPMKLNPSTESTCVTHVNKLTVRKGEQNKKVQKVIRGLCMKRALVVGYLFISNLPLGQLFTLVCRNGNFSIKFVMMFQLKDHF